MAFEDPPPWSSKPFLYSTASRTAFYDNNSNNINDTNNINDNNINNNRINDKSINQRSSPSVNDI